MKTLFVLFLSVLTLSTTAAEFYSKFSPHEGTEAFEIIYDKVKASKKTVYASIYSWSDKGITDSFKEALANGVDVRIVLHPSLAKKTRVKKVAVELEELGAHLKVAKMNMHEKFVLIDNQFVVNSSANMSGGAKSRYSENFIYHDNTSKQGKELLKQFKKEFVILWNSAKDIFTADEAIAPRLTFKYTTNLPEKTTSVLYSSSMNYISKENKPTSKAYKQGKYITLSRNGGTRNQTWQVRDVIIKEIDNAKKNVLLSLNHFNIKAISDALIRAVKRGVEVKLTVDNQEFKTYINNKEMTPQFVADWKKIEGNKKLSPPVRVKFYSMAPSPRHWLLNHHKFIIIDFDEKEIEKTILISGSYNLSRTAEHNQFDNMVVYKGIENQKIFREFKGEFDNQWTWNRDNQDKPSEEVLSVFTTLKGDSSIPLHSKKAVALEWSEIKSIRSKVNRMANGIFKSLYKNRDCLYYDIAKKSFWGCPK
jgi:phosphatidylserine/phosphatidylglycerophosphate/cardiolipin synthase-like enzyme